jgi:heme peroxidase
VPDGKLDAQAGLACFMQGDYPGAERHYAAAIQAGGPARDRHEWQEMLDLAQANATAKIDVQVPPPRQFKQADLLAWPVVSRADLPDPPGRSRRQCCIKRLRLWLGDLLGAVATVLMDFLIKLVGWVFGYRARVWTNWYHRWLVVGVLLLAHVRELLNANNLKSTYPPGKRVAFLTTTGPDPAPGVSHFRTADGSWNNPDDPKEGAANTRFLRNVELSATYPETAPRLFTPDPREVSRTLLTRPDGADGRPEMAPVLFLNLLAASWIQFMNHDWVSHGDVADKSVITVPLQPGDPAATRYGKTALVLGETQADPTRGVGGNEPAATSFINEVTHWWDGSQIYGSDQDTQNRLRSGNFGKMRLNPDGTLPVDPITHVEEAGFMRNWWVGLSMLHTLFVREHNAICDMLHQAYPGWDDKKLFNVARLINAAVMAKIHSVEWTPAILPNKTLEMGLNSNWYGLLTYLWREGKARKTLAEVNIRNPELGGIVGNPINRHHAAFGLTEEFVEVYRLHSLLPETLQLQCRGKSKIDPRAFAATRQHGSACMTQECTDNTCPGSSTVRTKQYAMSDLFYSFGNQHPGALVLNNFPRFMQELSVPGNPFFDLGTVDILRARERGVPRYNAFRRQLGLKSIHSFGDLTDNPKVLANLRSVYGGPPDKVEDLDLLIGTLAEGERPSHFGFGETVFQIFIVSASRRLQADRFYTDCYNEEVYTAQGLRWIDETDLKTVILRHYPELADTGLANIKNAFEPWDAGPVLDPKHHPLREWDSELKDDPWRGDAYRDV